MSSRRALNRIVNWKWKKNIAATKSKEKKEKKIEKLQEKTKNETKLPLHNNKTSNVHCACLYC